MRKGLIEPPDELEDCVYICIYPGEVFYFSSPFLGLSWRCTTTKHSEMNLKKNIFSTPQQQTFFNSFLYIPIAATFRPCFSAADINENTYSFIKEIETDTVSSAVLRYFFLRTNVCYVVVQGAALQINSIEDKFRVVLSQRLLTHRLFK